MNTNRFSWTTHVVRQGDLAWVCSALKRAQSVAMIGWPKIGKTCLLSQLACRMPDLQSVGLLLSHIDCARLAADADADAVAFWRKALFDTPDVASLLQPARARLEAERYDALALHSTLLPLLGQHRLVLVLDHAEAMVEHPGLRSMVLHGGLRALSGDADAPLRLVLACQRDIAELNHKLARPGGSPLFNHLLVRRLALLEDEQVRELFTAGEAQQTGAELDAAELGLIVAQAGGHPGIARILAQLLCDVRRGGQGADVALARAQHFCLPLFDEVMASLHERSQAYLRQLAAQQTLPFAREHERLLNLGLLAQRGSSVYIRSPLFSSYLLASSAADETPPAPLWYVIFADEDRAQRDDLYRLLRSRVEYGRLRYWDRACAPPGTIVAREAKYNREQAAVVLFLRSPALWSSPDCIEDLSWLANKVSGRLSSAASDELQVVPLLLSADPDFGHPLQKLQPLLERERSLSDFRSAERGWEQVLQKLSRFDDGPPSDDDAAPTCR